MRYLTRISLFSLLLVSTPWAASAADGYLGAPATFSLTQRVQVPGESLKPGAYTIQVTQQINDRVIVRIESESTHAHVLFLAVQKHDSEARGPVDWNAAPDHGTALRGFVFPNGAAIEFVYPKEEAAGLAKLNSAKVLAVDPESQGLPRFRNLPPDDMKILNLWMLSLTTASPNDKTPAILAQRYQPADTTTVAAARTPAAPVTRPAPAAKPYQVASVEPAPRPVAAPARHAAVIAVLPHTASELPAIALAGLLCLLAAAGLRLALTAVRS